VADSWVLLLRQGDLGFFFFIPVPARFHVTTFLFAIGSLVSLRATSFPGILLLTWHVHFDS